MDYKYFTEKELACRCGCGVLRMDDKFMSRIVRSRMAANVLCRKFEVPNTNAQFNVTSGCRCKAHNKAVGGVQNSRHLTTKDKECSAIDIGFKSYKQMIIILVALFIRGGFTHLGINLEKNFIHVDDLRKWVWFY